jgi:hypothetical protein
VSFEFPSIARDCSLTTEYARIQEKLRRKIKKRRICQRQILVVKLQKAYGGCLGAKRL